MCALDTLRPALRPPSDVPLDHTRRRFLRGRDCAVRAEFHHWRRDQRFHPGMAAFGGRVLCANHRIPPDRGIRDSASWKCGKLPLCRWKTHSQSMEKDRSFPTACKQVSHSAAYMTVYAHSHNACCCEYPSYPE